MDSIAIFTTETLEGKKIIPWPSPHFHRKWNEVGGALHLRLRS